MILLAAVAIAASIYVCFAYAERAERMLGHNGRKSRCDCSAFILFAIDVQIFWTGASDLILSLHTHISHRRCQSPVDASSPPFQGARGLH